MSTEAMRNVAIVVALAAIVWLVPGGGDGADIVAQTLSAAFIIATVAIAGRLYQQFRGEIFALGDEWRLTGYAALGVLMVTLAASERLFDTPPGTFLWLGLVAGSGYALYLVWRQHREYV